VTWTALPDGEGLELVAGQLYAVVASVKANHSAADLRALALARGLVLTDYAEQGARAGLGPDPRSPDYRYVAAIAQATQNGSLRWGVPWPISMADDSHLVQAWTSPPAGAPSPAPAPPRPPPDASPSMRPLAYIGLAAGALWIWRGRRARPYARRQ
jgi:hypothetical protein